MSIVKKSLIPIALVTVLSMTVSVQPASAASIFDHELNVAATHHANATYGTTTPFDLWFSGSQTLIGLTPAAAGAAARQIPRSDAALNKLIVNKTNALAAFVRDVTGHDPRNPSELAYLQAALGDYAHVLNSQRNKNDWASARGWFDSLEYRQYDSVKGHDEFRRRLLYQCANCAREITLGVAGGTVGLIYTVSVNGTNTRAIIGASIGAGTGFLIGAIVGLLANHNAYNAAQVEALNRNARQRLAEMTTLALIAAQEAEQAAHQTRMKLGQRIDDAERNAAAGATFGGFGGRLRWLWSGHL
jgi:hypothetical protein